MKVKNFEKIFVIFPHFVELQLQHIFRLRWRRRLQ